MTAENTYLYSGFQLGVIYELNSKGRPKAVNTTPYTGIEVYATKAYSPSLPQPRKVPHTGNDRLLKTQIFPGQEPATAELSVGAEDLDLIAMLAGTTVKQIAGMNMLPHLHDLQGKETQVGLILYQAALSRVTSAQGYHFHFISSSKMVVRLPGAGESPIDVMYDLTLNPSEYYLWGAALAPLSDIYDPLSGVPETGVFEAGIFSGFSEFEPRIASFISGNNTTVFDFPASMPAVDVAKIAVFTAQPTDDETVLVPASDYTPAVTGVTMDTGLTTGTEVHIVYQKAA
jgi:hypothetical protein